MITWNTIFWILFVILGAAIIFQTAFNIFFLDIAFGLMVIVIGIHKINEELSNREFERQKKEFAESIRYLTNWMDKSHSLTRNLKERHENRLYHLDVKRADLDEKIEKTQRDLIRKMVEIENRLNDATKVIVQEFKKRQQTEKRLKALERKHETLKERMKKIRARK